MAMYINDNLMSLQAQNALSSSGGALATAMQRLSTGLRINSAKDDAAGLAISDQMTSQINGMTQATQNANDAINLAQTTEGALQEVTNNLQSIRTLAVEAANSTNSASDRADLQAQVQQSLQAIDQIASTTQFNGQNVLDGTFGTAQFQVGANVGNTVALNLSTSMATSAIGKTVNQVGGAAYNGVLAVGQQGAGVAAAITGSAGAAPLTIAVGSNTAVAVSAAVAGPNATYQPATSAYAASAAINGSNIAGVTATADTTVQTAWADVAANSGYTLSINGTNIETASNNALTGSAVASAINAQSNTTGVTASFTNGVMTLNAADGSNITVSQTGATTAGTGMGTAHNGGGVTNNTVNAADTALTTVAGTAVSNTFVGSVQLTGGQPLILAGAGAAAIGYTAGTYGVTGSLNSNSVSTISGANQMINSVDAAIQSVDSLRSSLGAIQNRFQSVINSLSSSSQNLTSSRASIMDTNFASETAVMTQQQILQQAGTAILAQANASPQSILKLIQ